MTCKVTFFGDSITQGANATDIYAPPHQPGYAGLVMSMLLASAKGISWEYRNNSVGGWSINNAVASYRYRVNDTRSDIIVLGFGMNDGGATPKKYGENFRSIISGIREKQPNTAIILVGPTRANPKSKVQSRRVASEYVRTLQDISRDYKNVAVADVTAAWDYLMRRKAYYDLTGNGLNHPNDFGHRVIAEVVLKALGL